MLFLIDQLCETGGAERVLLKMAHLLPDKGFRCSIATFKIDTKHELFRNICSPLYVLPMQKTYGWTGIKAAMTLYKVLKSQRVRLVHTFFESSDIWGGVVAGVAARVPVVSSRRDMGILRSRKHDLAYRVVNHLFARVITVSDQVRNFCITQDRLPRTKVVTIYNGIDTRDAEAPQNISSVREWLGIKHASHVVASIGHLRPIKGTELVIEAAARVCKRFPRTVFLMVGDISDYEYYRNIVALVQARGLQDNIRFIGSSEEVFSILKASDCFCLLSRSEGFSNVILEAMACEKPCVVSRVGGNVEAVEHGVTGYLVEPGSPDTAAEFIIDLLSCPELSNRIGKAAGAVVRSRFTTDIMIDNLCRVYREVLDSKAASRRFRYRCFRKPFFHF